MSLASVAAQQSQLAAAADAAAASAAQSANTASNSTAGGSGTSGASSSATGNAALASLTNNFNSFLQLLMTQLQNQDPTSPMDTNQFTSELVQFASVQQQINTNNSLSQLIQLTQGSEMLQASSLVGKQVLVQSNQLPLQNGSATLQFSTSSAQPVAIAIYNAQGQEVRTVTLQSDAGANTWTWDGTNDAGTQMPDGVYSVAVYGMSSGGTPVALPFTVEGTVSGVATQNGAVQLQLGPMSTNLNTVQQVLSN
ncbi:MAG: flagellar biosynthesis protein FlgD [Acidobacteriia bacterium]|nr:flagellar biosynthesis protein FlgD [Methyloceanibacter sp.]MBX5471694.1 flagellar biosynthesis protein FlgD [Acetobacteraceae bacterium]MCL6492461.1 flagellar biosynthesis protein FlgD [Terriglobia bacterium]